MTQALQPQITFDEFVEWLPETSECRYELHRGVIVEMPKPRGKHSKLSGDLAYNVGTAIRQANLPYFIPKECIVRSMDGNSGYEPDVIVLDEPVLIDEPDWESGSILHSANRSRSLWKLFQPIGGMITSLSLESMKHWVSRNIGLWIMLLWVGDASLAIPNNPLSLSVQLVDGEYELQQFREGDRLISATLPNLALTVDQVFAVGH
jgi:Uma2 family endonuclease